MTLRSFLVVFKSLVIVCIITILFIGCTLQVGGPGELAEPPAPTTIPLDNPAAPTTSTELTPPDRPIMLPPGFGINVYASGLDEPRMLEIGPDGQLYVAERAAGRILRLPDRDNDGRADGEEVVGDGLSFPSSLAFYQDGSLYVGETTRVLRLSQPDPQGFYLKYDILVDGLPQGGHSTRTVLFSPDWSMLLVSIGSSCNVCQEQDARRAAIIRYNPDGSGEQLLATGLRNAVGLVFRPGTDELWVTNNGRDLLGDDLPPETVYLVRQGDNAGWPVCHAGRIVDPQMGNTNSCEGVLQPQVEMQAHSAPLGLEFYTGDQFPEQYRGDLFVAFHGSWNRSTPTGYKIVHIPMNGNQPGPAQDFATGWLVERRSWGRPVDLVTGTDGSLYLSDDSRGLIYRIYYHGRL